MTEPVQEIRRALMARHLADRKRFRTPEGLAHAATAERVVNALSRVAQSDDIDVILDAEMAALRFEKDHRVNSSGMDASLRTAMRDLKIAKVSLDLVRTASDYRLVNSAYQRESSRVGSLPRDEARQFFRSHFARLLNQDKAGLDQRDKRILTYRRQNIRRAEKLYIGLQRVALGFAAEQPSQARGRTRGGRTGR